MSASLNTVSGTIYEDFVRKIIRVEVSDTTASVIMKCIVVVVGIVCVILVVLVEKLKGIVQVSFVEISTNREMKTIEHGIYYNISFFM